MSIFGIQVKTRDEEKYIELFYAQNPDRKHIRIYFPKRELRFRKLGKITTRIVPVFSGYIFVELEKKDRIMNHYLALRTTSRFIRFLPSNKKVRKLQGCDLEIAVHFIRQLGQVAGVSKVYFDENDKIVIKEGPLLGLEGSIVKVDRRKGRAKVKLDLYGDSFLVDLSFVMIEPKGARDSPD
jgi:transcriptional antiterminator NusG